MPAFIDLTGKRFDRLWVFKRVELGRHNTHWLCQCDCGRWKFVAGGNLKNGRSLSCACVRNEILSQISSTHRMSYQVPEYTVWKSMRDRCNNPKNIHYHRYGGRGITVCERWNQFELFLSDMGQRPSDDHSIERVDNDAGYSPENCIWAPEIVQANNKSTNHRVTFNGIEMSMADAARQSVIPYGRLKNRIRRGWPESRWFISGS